MRRITLCVVVCLLLFGALAQARALPFNSSSRSYVHHQSAHASKAHKKAHKKAKKHAKKQIATLASITAAKPLALASTAGSTHLFGDSTVESGVDSNSAGWAEAFPVASQIGGQVSSIVVYVAAQNKATSLAAGIYSNSNGHAGSLLTSGTLASPKAGAWNKVIVTSTAINAGTYWIALLGHGGDLYFKDRSNGPCVSQNSSQTSTASLNSTWPAGGPTWASCPVSAYVDGTPGTTTTTTTTATTTTPTTTTTTTVPPVLPPVNAIAPSVSGNATNGQTVTTSNGTWLDAPTTYAYQWQDCNSSGASCTTIAGATASSYRLTDVDIGKTVRSVVTARNSAGSASAASAPTAAVAAPPAPADAAAPSISGSTVQGQSLTTTNGTWSGNPTMYSYQWEDCNSSGSSCSNIAGATGNVYTLGSGDVGHTVRSVVTAGNAGGSSSASSAASAVVTAPTTAPSNTALPAVSGTTRQGQTVSTSNGSWSSNPTSFSYKWEDCNTSGTGCSIISGATSISYALQAGDAGDTIRSVVTATNSAGSASATSAQTAVIAAIVTAPSNTAAPAVSGTTTMGQSLTTSNGSWSGSPTSFAYQWQDCNSSGTGCAAISGATSSSYTLGSGDTGHTIRSVVTATNSAGSAPATSPQTAMVGSGVTAPSDTAAPAVSGTDTQGSTLTTSNGTWSGSPTSYAYHWQDCNTSGTGCANIAGATSSSYTLQAGDVSDTIRSVVTATNSAGSAGASSAPTATIAASSGGGGGSNYTCTQHVTTSTFASAYSSAGAGAVLCLAPGSYGSFNGSSKSSMVVITPDVSAGATAPTGNATGDVNGNVTFSGADFSPAANITMDGVTFTGDVSVSGASHDLLLHDSLFHQHLVITDTSMNNANVTASYDMFPGDKADCVGGPEGRIWINENSHSSTPDGVTIENSNIGGAVAQCDGVQTGGYGPQFLNNWIHDYHYQGNAHTDGIQDYGGSHELVKGNFMYNVPDCYVSYDGTDHADIENNICVQDGSQNNGASPNVLVINDDNGSIVKHNTLVAFKDSYGNAGGMLMVGSKSSAGTGTVLTDNVATGFSNCENGNCRPYTDSHNLFIQGGASGAGDVTGTPVYQGGACGSLTSSSSPFCTDSWSSFMLTASSPGHAAADDGTNMGAYGTGPVAPGE